MADKLTEITIYDQQNEDGNHYNLQAKINEEKNLVLDGYDIGPQVEELWGPLADGDYEYWLTVPAEWKDTVLLHLIGERFEDDVKFKEWLNEKGIPNEFDCYV